MWWMYFGGDDERAVDAMDAASPRQRPMWAITGYSFAHYVMIFGVLLFAAGTHRAGGELDHTVLKLRHDAPSWAGGSASM